MADSERPEDAPFDGRWWLPESEEENVVGGRLELDGETWQVVLLGWLGTWDVNAGWGETPVHLHGSVGTTPVSLLGLSIRHVTSGFQTEPHRTVLGVETVIFGAHLDGQMLFDGAAVRLLHLNEWANRRPWGHTHQIDETTGVFEHRGIFTPPDQLQATLPGTRVVLGRSFGYSTSDFSELKMTSQEQVSFTFDSPQTMAVIERDYVRPLKNLVELAAASRSPVIELEVTPHGSGRLSTASRILSSAGARSGATTRNWFSFLFNLGAVPFDQVIPSWWALHAEIGPVSDLVASLWDDSLNVSNRFLAGATAIEGYHRHKFPGSPRNTRFADRLDAVAAMAGPRFAAAIGDPQKWRDWVRDGRNAIAHRDPGMLDIEREWRTAIGVAASMHWLMVLVLLADLNIPDAVFEPGLRQLRILDQLAHYLRAEKPDWFV